MDFEQGVEAFRDFYLGEGYSPDTVKGMVYTLRTFVRFLKSQGVRSWAELRPEHARAYQIELLGSKVQDTGTRLTSVRRMGDFLVKEGLVFEHPSEGLKKMPREPLAPMEPLEASEVQAIIDACDIETRVGIRDHALLSVMWEGCLNFSEAMHLTLDNLSDDRGTLTIQGKSYTRGMPLSAETRASLDRYIESARVYFLRYRPDDKVLFVSANGRGFERRWIGGVWPVLVGPYLKKAGILKRVKGQALRWARVKYLIEQGVPEEEVRAMAGYGKTGFDTFLARIR